MSESALTTFIVEDEPPARDHLRSLTGRRRELRWIGEAADGPTAVESIRLLAPDVLLIDVEIPELDGLAVLTRLLADDQAPPHVVFVTAFDRYAVRAFDVPAIDYLLKPVTHERFDRAIDRCVEAARGELQPGDGDKREGLAAPPKRLLLREGHRIVLVPVDEIDWIEAERDYVRIHRGEKSYLLERTLTAMETLLAPRGFARIHRSSLVNLERVAELTSEGSGRYRVRLTDGTKLSVSRSHSARFRATML